MSKQDTHFVRSAEARAALASPIRLEILGNFVEQRGMSISEIARRMGRKASSLYYHFQMLEDVGILRRAGSRRAGKRDEVLFEPAADRIGLEAGDEQGIQDARRVLASAFRMALSDFDAAVESGTAVTEGPQRDLVATRLHCRLTPEALEKLNHHLDGIERLLAREMGQRTLPPNADHYVSLTLAMLPMKGRGEGGESQ